MRYDHIVIGAGSAGAALAGRLSEDPTCSVLLVEAGSRTRSLNVRIPAAFAKQFKTALDWEFYTEPEPELEGRSIYHPRGKMLGGCSGQNAMIYIRGNRADYDGWAAAGATGWSYDELLPYFTRSEHNSRGASTYHGADGPMYVEDPRSPNPLSEASVAALCASGFDANDDFNGARQEGAGLYQVTQRRGRRWTTADGFLDPARRRRNLTVLTGAVAERIVVEHGRAVGVDVRHDGRTERFESDGDIVLSAGAFQTPQLLMLSGVGPADHLREHGIDVVVDNPHVGAHLMDHPMYLLSFETTFAGTLAGAEHPLQLLTYLGRRRGLLTSNVGETGAFYATRAGLDAPDMQFIGAPGYFFEHGLRTYASPAFGVGCSLVGSRSEGRVWLRSGDVGDKPAVRFDYFSAPEDMAAMVTAMERAREVFASAPLREYVGDEIHPGPAARTRTDLERQVRHEVEHTYHPSCTARMGAEGDGVVGPDLRVHGLDNLRVADASVFPRIPHGNTHAPTLMVGEKAADLVRGRTTAP